MLFLFFYVYVLYVLSSACSIFFLLSVFYGLIPFVLATTRLRVHMFAASGPIIHWMFWFIFGLQKSLPTAHFMILTMLVHGLDAQIFLRRASFHRKCDGSRISV